MHQGLGYQILCGKDCCIGCLHCKLEMIKWIFFILKFSTLFLEIVIQVMYQFLATASNATDSFIQNITDKDGNKTGHLVGLLNRTVMLIDNGLKPAWVFDGKPPQFKEGEVQITHKFWNNCCTFYHVTQNDFLVNLILSQLVVRRIKKKLKRNEKSLWKQVICKKHLSKNSVT